MCGIAGIISAEPVAGQGQSGQAMLQAIAHRGPDDHGWLCWGRQGLRGGQGRPDDGPVEVMLVHRRLAIIDLSRAGRQPMSSPDGRYHIAFNGEIYNYLELRGELESAGWTFRTRTDTEVLLAALATWGRAALRRLVGMFALALLDAHERTVLLARDFFGMKPLFYTCDAGRLAFASEIKGLLALSGVSRRVDPDNLYGYLQWQITDTPGGTMLEAVRRVPPGHWLLVRVDHPAVASPEAYWRLEPRRPSDLSLGEAAARLRELFLENVRLHLRSDVPVGTALSGGIDSSAVVGAFRRVAGPQAELHAFSYVADDARLSEERWIEKAAGASRAIVHKVRIHPDELREDLDRLIAAQDEPFLSTSVYAQYRVCRLARETGVKVLLDGQGADELLAGYRGYLFTRLRWLLRQGRLVAAGRLAAGMLRQPGVSGRGVLAGLLLHLLPDHWERALRAWLAHRPDSAWLRQPWFQERGVAMDMPAAHRGRRSLREKLRMDVCTASLPSLLRYEDRNSMAMSLESRLPFLTPALAEFVLDLPEAYLVSAQGVGKHVFRLAMRGIVPDAILDRRDKIGFETPELQWLRALRPWVEEVLQSDAARAIPVIDAGEVLRQARAMLDGRAAFEWRVWRTLNLIRWSQIYRVEY